MSASGSDLSEASQIPTPPDHELEKALRQEVIKAQKKGVDFSLKYIRTAAETQLGLAAGFYKGHQEWNQRSKDIVTDQIGPPSETQISPPKPTPKKSSQAPAKRKSSGKAAAPSKRQKTKTPASDDDDGLSDQDSSPLSDAMSDFEEGSPKPKPKPKELSAKPRTTKSKPTKAKPKKVEVEEDDAKDEEQDRNGSAAAKAAEDSESELSVLDDGPAPKPKRKSKDPAESKSKPTKKASTKSKPDTDDPDQAEIKRLQGWLVKCGIRKVWGKELKPYESPKAKIKHLKDMLSEAGMTGRYSAEKASQIKEARELAADIEAVQEGAERWGADEEEERGRNDKDAGADGRPPARRLVRGAKNYDFLSSDGEETD